MLASDRLAPPVGYSGWWTVLGALLLALVVAGVAVILLTTRTRVPRASRAQIADARATALAGIASVDEQAGAGLSAREAYLQLSGIVRAYVSSTRPGWSRSATSMTLADLDVARTDRESEALADFVRSCYPVEFAASAHGDPARAAAAARRLVSTWS